MLLRIAKNIRFKETWSDRFVGRTCHGARNECCRQDRCTQFWKKNRREGIAPGLHNLCRH